MNTEIRSFIDETRKRLDELEKTMSKVEDYPYVKISKISDSVLLFTARNTGIKINGSTGSRFGDDCGCKAGWDETWFTPFSGTITYKNGQPVRTESEESC